jgi:hypothetical protein
LEKRRSENVSRDLNAAPLACDSKTCRVSKWARRKISHLEKALWAVMAAIGIAPPIWQEWTLQQTYSDPVVSEPFRLGAHTLRVSQAAKVTRRGDSSNSQDQWPVQIVFADAEKILGVEQVELWPHPKRGVPPASLAKSTLYSVTCVTLAGNRRSCRHPHVDGRPDAQVEYWSRRPLYEQEIEVVGPQRSEGFIQYEDRKTGQPSRCELYVGNLTDAITVSVRFDCSARAHWLESALAVKNRLRSNLEITTVSTAPSIGSDMV